MRKFVWTKTWHGGKTGPIYYESNKLPILEPNKKEFAEAKITTRNLGPCTAHAEMRYSVEWATNGIWGYSISRFFYGRQA